MRQRVHAGVVATSTRLIEESSLPIAVSVILELLCSKKGGELVREVCLRVMHTAIYPTG
ncbi:hypothetical protein APHMUC_1360 [Anaplasma phagocytophilum str. ApMUC09]|uniref:Uncharacterized protein n=1 Tax=Anaplasma phagocytophilum str. ApMUC09 TaxID=1359152 RepID=A0A0F3ND97_ANAPH|nr:hypothetical protein APHMUC_1360 [Anaplasma phagocytophilum str. ApMUC09]